MKGSLEILPSDQLQILCIFFEEDEIEEDASRNV